MELPPLEVQNPEVVSALSELEWNFDAVPNSELVACCYWEYARESAFIRDVRKRSWECWKPHNFETDGLSLQEERRLHQDIQKAQRIGYPAEVFLRGMAFPPEGALPLKPGEVEKPTGSFPKPWQTLPAEERRDRSRIGTDVSRIPLVPFKRGTFLDAKDIREYTSGRLRAAELEREEVKRQNPKLNEEALHRLGKLKYPDILPSLYQEGGGEVTVVSINWGSFTNDEIANYFRKWVKSNRPKYYPAPSRKGHKPGDWRANLTRLAAMRLLSHYTPKEMIGNERGPATTECRAILESKQFGGRKWGDATKWFDARREAGALFRKLFPFLSPEEKPISWKRLPISK